MPRTLLLADDSQVIHGLVERGLAGQDIILIASREGSDAIEIARSLRPDIVLADVNLPGINGYEVCEALKQSPELRGVPIVLMTGAFDPYDPAKARAVGADDHITKPFEADILVECLRTQLSESDPNLRLDPLLTDDLQPPKEMTKKMAQSTAPTRIAHPDSSAPNQESRLEDDLDLLDVLPLPKDDLLEDEFEEGELIGDPFDNSSSIPSPAPPSIPSPAPPSIPSPAPASIPSPAPSLDEGFDFGAPISPLSADPEPPPVVEVPQAGPAPSARFRQEIHDSIEEVATEAFADYPETLVKTLVERFEAIAWEVIPRLAETLIQEEIRRMKNGDE